jgi:hypothetical protein
MWYEDPHILAAAITAVASVGVCLYLHEYLVRILHQYAGNSLRGRFWAAIAEVLLVLVPVSIVLAFGRVPDTDRSASTRIVLELLSRGFLGLVGAVVLLTIVIGIFGQTHGTTVFIDAEETDELTRLLLKIRELRARELIRKADLNPLTGWLQTDHDPTNGNF